MIGIFVIVKKLEGANMFFKYAQRLKNVSPMGVYAGVLGTGIVASTVYEHKQTKAYEKKWADEGYEKVKTHTTIVEQQAGGGIIPIHTEKKEVNHHVWRRPGKNEGEVEEQPYQNSRKNSPRPR